MPQLHFPAICGLGGACPSEDIVVYRTDAHALLRPNRPARETSQFFISENGVLVAVASIFRHIPSPHRRHGAIFRPLLIVET
jgi:hypothetical protein